MSAVVSQPEGNYYDKYGTRNPIARHLMAGFLASFTELATMSRACSAFEVGCGEGHLSVRLAEMGLAVRAMDIAESCVAKTKAHAANAGVTISAHVGDVASLTKQDAAELVVCCEVLEHLDNPVEALERLSTLATPWLLASVPREPLWRALNMARGKYWADWGNTPGHVQHWSSKKFLDFIAARFELVAVRQPLPWTMVLARVR
jgi:2-polyprenyl-3-methyl-5-hydroxy-6-metoxy-1,4-benzoquinol methylase